MASKTVKFRRKVKGTSERPRLCVFRSHNHIYAQLIDDVQGKTLVSSSTLDTSLDFSVISSSTCEASALVGQSIARKSLSQHITTVVFDRGKRRYHGRVKALSEAARKEGLKF